jgi:hypothetical protein
MKRGRNKGKSGAIKTVKDLERRVPKRFLTDPETAQNRRELLERLNPEAADFTRREFAKLGLFQ